MKRIASVILFASLSLLVWGQNPVSMTVEQSDETSASFNLRNINGFWHISGPRSYENNNNLSIFWNNGTYKRYLTLLDNGNVGIGTDTPTGRLDVRGSIVYGLNSNIKTIVHTNGDGNSYFNFMGGSANSRIGFQIDGSSKMSIMNNGNVGIGKLPSNAKLDVAGNIKAQEIEVTLASMQDLNLNGTLAANNITYTANGQTADHVFEADYNLRSLEEIEAFILENKHLPDVPSAEAMEEEGVNLAEMNKLLLQKVEELTLYTIDLEKRDKELIDRLEIKDEQMREMQAVVERQKEELLMIKEMILRTNPNK